MCNRVVKFSGLLTVIFLVLFITTVDAKEKNYVFKLGHIVGATSTHGISVEKFAKAVAAETNGNIKINVGHSASLGSGPENVESLRMGTLEMALLWPSFLTSFDKRFQIEELPFAWSKRWQVYAAYRGDLGNNLKQMAEKFGIKMLAFYELGYRCATNNVRPIEKPEDFRGIKIRSAEAPLRLDLFRTLGANPIPMAFGELYTGLQLGTVDGQENPVPLIYSSKFYEVQKYLSITKHIWTTAVLSINKKLWDSLSKNHQEILQRNAFKYAEYNSELVREGEQTLEGELVSKGMKVNHPKIEPFLKAVEPIWNKYTPVFGKEFMDLVHKYTVDY